MAEPHAKLSVAAITSTRIIKSVVTGQAPATMDWKNTPGEKTKHTKSGKYTSKGAHIHLIYYPPTALALPPSSRSEVTSRALLPPPHYGTCLPFYRENNSVFPSLVDSGRIIPTHGARRSKQPILCFSAFSKKKKKKHHGGNRTQGPTLVEFEGGH